MEVIVTVKLMDSQNRTINLANANKYEVGTFAEAAAILDKILKFLNKLAPIKERED